VRAAALSAVLYLAVTAAIGVDVLKSPAGGIAHDPGDPLLAAAILTWNATHTPLTEAWWQFPIFHPTRDALAFSEHMLGVSVLATPLLWLTGNTLATYHATLLLTYPLCGLAMYALVFRLTRSGAAAFLAGLAYALAPYRTSQLPHLQLLMMCYAPLVLLSLHAFVETRRRRWLALFGISWMLQGAATGYMLVYGSVLVGCWTLWFVIASRRWREAGAIAASLLLAALPLAPVLARYVSVHGQHGFSRGFGEAGGYGADVTSVLCAPPLLTFWGWLRVACRHEGELFPGAALVALVVVGAIVLRKRTARDRSIDSHPAARDSRPAPNLPPPSSSAWTRARRSSPAQGRALTRIRAGLLAASAAFALVALSALVVGPWQLAAGPLRASVSSAMKPFSSASYLLLAAALLSPRLAAAARASSVRGFYLVAAVGAWVLAWGPAPAFLGTQVLYQGPFAWLMWLPGFDGVRVPARFWLVSLLCLIVLMGLVIADLLKHTTPRVRRAIVAAAAVALAMDGWTRIPMRPAPVDAPRPDLLRGGVVLELPLGQTFGDIAAEYRAVLGGWRTVNGFSGYQPAGYEALVRASEEQRADIFAPFAGEEIHVLVAEEAVGLRRMMEDQPGSERVGQRNSRPPTPNTRFSTSLKPRGWPHDRAVG
jgi:hypothetical protein